MTAVRIAVIALSDSFSEIWDSLGRFCGCSIEVVESVGAVQSMGGHAGVLINAAGVEKRATAVLEELLAAGVEGPAVIGADTNYRLVVALMRGGASNYFCFPDDLADCRGWLVERVESVLDKQAADAFAADAGDRFDFSKLIGRSPLLRDALRRTSRIIPGGAATILITGETGTGKELLARAIHYNSDRASSPFVDINCTTLPENLLEAELFGYEPGAFTDARTSKPGLFEVANGGTLFLDEIGDLTVALQAKLLRVLEEKRIRRLGGVREIELDIRVVAATHVDLPAAIRAGKFRQDLYYRLNVVPIRLPSLRERGEDVIELAEHLLGRFSQQYRVPCSPLTAEIKRALRSHEWPGNVRELRNSMERAVLLGGGNIVAEDLFPEEVVVTDTRTLPFPASMLAIERSAAAAMIVRCGGNKSEAAKELGISRKHLYSLIRQEGDT